MAQLTRVDVKEIVQGIVDESAEGLAEIIGKSFNHVEQRFNGVETRLESVESSVHRMERILNVSVERLDDHGSRIERLEGRVFEQ